MSTFEEFKTTIVNEIIKIKRSKEKLILFGAADIGVSVKKVLDYLNIRVENFCDNDLEKQRYLIEGLEVIPIAKINEPKKLRFIICTLNKYNEKNIRKTLEDIGVKNIHSVYSMLFLYKTRIVKYALNEDSIIRLLHSFEEDNKNLVIDAINIPITEKCTLNCEKCSSLTPYNHNPNHFDKDIILNSMSRFVQAIDGIKRVIITGGEPLLNPCLLEIVEKIAKSPKVLHIQVMTNGTIIPNNNILQKFSEIGISLSISDYGELSNKKNELIKLCEYYNVHWDVNTYSYNTWVDFGPFNKRRYRNKDDNKALFKKCWHWVIATYILDGNYYLCHRSAYTSHFNTLKQDGEYINLLNYNVSLEELKYKIWDLTSNTQYLTACDYCNTRFGEVVPPAVQATKKLEYD